MTLVWVGWLLAIIISFALLEWFAIHTGRLTLSRVVVNATRAWPLLSFVIGLLLGGLAVHFWWPWCP